MSGAITLDSLIKPMEPRSYPRPFASKNHRFQIKWDGVRMMAFVGQGGTRLQNRKLRDRSRQYPEILRLPALLHCRQAVLDGEMVVLHRGKPSFPRIMERDLATRDTAIARLARVLPATYAVFDLLMLDGNDLTGCPWWERQARLREVLEPGPEVHLTENFEDGPALFQAVTALGLEGIVGKELDSPYLPGRKSRHWLKIKSRRCLLCVVGGYTRSGERVGALLVGAFRERELYYLGRVGSGLSERDLLALGEFFEGITTSTPPFVNPPHLAKGTFRWVEPRLTVMVEFQEWTEDMKLRAPVVAGFSREPPGACEV